MDDKKKEFHDRIFESRMNMAKYMMEHKEPSEELTKAHKELLGEYARYLNSQVLGGEENDKHKGR